MRQYIEWDSDFCKCYFIISFLKTDLFYGRCSVMNYAYTRSQTSSMWEWVIIRTCAACLLTTFNPFAFGNARWYFICMAEPSNNTVNKSIICLKCEMIKMNETRIFILYIGIKSDKSTPIFSGTFDFIFLTAYKSLIY